MPTQLIRQLWARFSARISSRRIMSAVSLPAESNRPPWYTPYIVADLAEAPWPVQTSEHSAANTRWMGLRQAAKAPKIHHLRFQGWVLYRFRFVFTADFLGAWSTFGGLSAQLNHMSIILPPGYRGIYSSRSPVRPIIVRSCGGIGSCEGRESYLR